MSITGKPFPFAEVENITQAPRVFQVNKAVDGQKRRMDYKRATVKFWQ